MGHHGQTRQQLPVLLLLVLLLLPVCLPGEARDLRRLLVAVTACRCILPSACLALQHLQHCRCCCAAVATGAAAQEPIGAPAACSAGHTYRVVCFIDSSGYLADVQFSNTQRNTPVSACGTQAWQLDGSRAEVMELSDSDTFLRMRACGDAGGLRGLEFRTALGTQLSCGRPQADSCRVFSSRSTYPLRGFQATCENLNPGNRHRDQSLVTRVSSIKAACWTPARRPAAGGALSVVCVVGHSPAAKSIRLLHCCVVCAASSMHACRRALPAQKASPGPCLSAVTWGASSGHRNCLPACMWHLATCSVPSWPGAAGGWLAVPSLSCCIFLAWRLKPVQTMPSGDNNPHDGSEQVR